MTTLTYPLYEQARQLLRAQPGLGKKKLAKLLGVKAPTARRLLERWRGETQGANPHPDYQHVAQLKREHPDWGAVKISQALGLSVDHAKLHLARWLGVQSSRAANAAVAPLPAPEAAAVPPVAPENELRDAVHGAQRDLEYQGTRIRTLAELLVFAEVDTREWEVERYTVNKYEVAAKTPEGLTTNMLYQIKCWLRRKVVEQQLASLTAALLAEYQKAAPVRPAIVRPPAGSGLLEISILDLHYGKLSWGAECGRDFNAREAESLFWHALEDLLAKAAGLKPARILFPIGNDLLNTDQLGKFTTNATLQDECLVWKQSFVQAKALLVRGIDRLRAVAPVHVVVVNGNHDTQRAFFIGDTIASWYRQTADVTVDNSPPQRKYVRHGACLLGYTHGNQEPHQQLPLLMATERKDDWAATRHRAWGLGHFHAKKIKVFVPHQDLSGVSVRILPSLCPADAWHASKGYTSQLAAEAYYWDAHEGCTCTLLHTVR